MTRVALVTGGTRGIGRAISETLKNKGYKVAANFAGNQQALLGWNPAYFFVTQQSPASCPPTHSVFQLR